MKTIVITAGHSNKDPGAVNGTDTESDVVVDFRNLVSFYLARDGVEHVKDGSFGENLPLNQAIKLITKDSIAVEFHCNASSSPNASGVETLSGDNNKDIGAKLCAAVANVLSIPNRGAKGESSGQHSRLGFVQSGGIILELFFISNAKDLRTYKDSKWLVAKAVAEVLKEAAQ